MKVIGGLVVALLAAVGIVVAQGGQPASGQDGDKVVLNIGMQQGIDSMNVVRGVTVAAFEAWNMQYATLTDKSAEDFSPIPGLAESWESSADKKTWTYTLRPNMKWSDGKPLTAEDVAYTINRSRDEAWLNHTAVVANLKARATSPTELVVTTSVPDPKLPTLDVYIVPKHVVEQYDEKAMTKWNGQTDVGSGPFTLSEFKKGQFARFKANPNFYGEKPALDEVVIRVFNNGDAMVAALRKGEIDFVQQRARDGVPRPPGGLGLRHRGGRPGRLRRVRAQRRRRAQEGPSGAVGPEGARGDRARDRQEDDRRPRRARAGQPAEAVSPSANPAWTPEIPEDKRFTFDLDRANQILDEAGYEDTDGDGVREMPNGGEPLRMRYAVRSESTVSAPIAEFITGWLREIGIATTQKTYDDGQLTEVIGRGDYDMFVWGWTPYVDPDTMLGYFTCDHGRVGSRGPDELLQRREPVRPGVRQALRAQKVELDPDKRMQIVHEMLTRFYESAVYIPLYLQADLQAYNKDKFEGWTPQPAESGPVLFSNTSPSYVSLKPAAATADGGAAGDGGGDDGGGGGLIIGLVALALLGVVGALVAIRRRGSADERE